MRKKIKVEIHLNSRHLLYDIDNVAHVIGGVLGDEDVTPKYRSDVQATNEAGNKDIILRALDNSFNSLVSGLTAYTKEDTVEDVSLSNVPVEKSEYILNLAVPQEVSRPNLDGAMTASHNYMVYCALSEWFTKVKKDEASIYMAKATTELENVKSFLSKRTKPIRLRQSPF